jgi:hypothetical protein
MLQEAVRFRELYETEIVIPPISACFQLGVLQVPGTTHVGSRAGA